MTDQPSGKPFAPRTTDVGHVLRAWGYSRAGLRAAWRHETAFRQEVVLCVLFVPLALWLGRSGVERALLLGSLLLVLVVEMLNSALEAVVDRISVEQHALSGRAKDMSSAAVLLALVITAVTWGLILYDRLTS